MMSITQFRPIKGFEGEYDIDNDGNVKSLINDIILKPSITKNGYKKVILCKEGKKYYKWVHRLVAEAFLPNTNNYPQVNHKKEFEKTNNHVELMLDDNGNVVVNYEKTNLEWCDAKYNINYGTAIKRRAAKRRGIPRPDVVERDGKPVVAVDKDNNIVYEFASTAEARLNGYTHVWDCCIGKRRTCGGYEWYFKSDWLEMQKEKAILV